MDSALRCHRDLTVIMALFSVSAMLVGSFTMFYYLSLGWPVYALPLFYGIQMTSVIAGCLFLGLSRLGRMPSRSLVIMSMLPLFLLYLTMGVAAPENLRLVSIATGVLAAASQVLYWLPFNSFMLWLTRRTNRATVIGYYGLIWPVLAIFLPIVGGTVIVRMGMWTDVAISSIVLVVLVIFLYIYAELPAIETFDVRAWKAMRELAPRLRWGILLNGIIDGTAGVATPLLGFQFARTALDYSIYLSAFSVAGAVAVFILAYLSDRIQNRYVFLYLSAIFLFPTGIALALFYGPTGYLIAISLNSFGLPLLGTLLMALMGDLSEKCIENCVLAREVLLNLGRLAGAMCILAILAAGVGMSFVLLQITVVSVLVLLLRR